MTTPIVSHHYKGFTPKAGVYCVVHMPSGRTLLGVSPHAGGRLNRLRFQLNLKSHPNASLQRDWNTDGEAAFRFEILDCLGPDASGEVQSADLSELLALWQAKLALPAEQSY